MARRATIRLLASALLALAAVGCGENDGEARTDEHPTLFLAGDGEMWVVDAESETSERFSMRKLIGGDPPHRVAARGDRIVLWGRNTWATDSNDPDGPLEAIARDSLYWIPSADPTRIWITVAGKERRRGLRSVREITADGATTVPDVKPPSRSSPEVALESGLLLATESGTELWDPHTGQVIRRFSYKAIGDHGPGHGDLLASCTHECEELILTDVASGERHQIKAPPGQTLDVWDGAFSPDGEHLALPVHLSDRGWDTPKQLAVLSLADGELSVIPGSGVPGGYTFVVWSESGNEVFITGGERFKPRVIVSYAIGESSTRRLDVEVGDFYDAAAK